MTAPITIVSGLGRCGSSLVMQMLAAGGHPIYGPEESRNPSYEHPNAAGLPNVGPGWNDARRAWLAEAEGKAVKVLDPHRCQLPACHEYRIIFCTRAIEQQARSQIKFLAAMGMATDDRATRRAMGKSLRGDNNHALAVLRGLPHAKIGIVSFEYMLDAPEDTAEIIARFLGIPLSSVSAMAAQVIRRSSDCYEGMLEFQQIQARGVAA